MIHIHVARVWICTRWSFVHYPTVSWLTCDFVGVFIYCDISIDIDLVYYIANYLGVNLHRSEVNILQVNLRITDTLGTGLLSFVERLSLSRRLSSFPARKTRPP